MFLSDIVDFFPIGFVLFFSLILGSFATALAYRVPHGIPWVWDKTKKYLAGKACRSSCPYCHTTLGVLDLIPVLSWIFLGGRCRYCKGAFGVRYLFIEAITVCACLGVYFAWGLSLSSLVIIICVAFLMALIVIDMDYFLLPNQLVFLSGLCGFLYLVIEGLENHGLQGLAGYMAPHIFSFFLYGGLAAFLGVVMTLLLKKDALGGGDVKFFAVAGLWLGPMYLPFFMMASGGIGIIWALFYNAVAQSKIFPFGPALIISLYIALLLKAYDIIPLVSTSFH